MEEERSTSAEGHSASDEQGTLFLIAAFTYAFHSLSRQPMPEQTSQGRIVETAKEARAGERGPSMLVVLTVSTVAVAVIFMALWYFLPG